MNFRAKEFCELNFATFEAVRDPLQEVLEATDCYDTSPSESIKNALLVSGVLVSGIDGQVSDEEAEIICDTTSYLEDDFDSIYDLGINQKIDYIERIIAGLDDLRASTSNALTGLINLLRIYDKHYGTDYADTLAASFFRFANTVAKADGYISEEEEKLLSELKSMLFNAADSQSENKDNNTNNDSRVNKNTPHFNSNSRNMEEVLAELHSMIGLEVPKRDIDELINFLHVQNKRAETGIPALAVSNHMVFFGKPGTGKTTVARLIAEAYATLGFLSKGHIVEADRSTLVAGYVGQTAIKTNEILQSAHGGVLFIDEAYTLNGSGRDDYGQEAIDTILKYMEDNREDIVIIVAGYEERMAAFLSSNPGLKSRFNKYLRFEDFTPEQLTQIFCKMTKDANYSCIADAVDLVLQEMNLVYKNRDNTFGNARLVRNYFEKCISNQANRVVSLQSPSQQQLMEIMKEDLLSITEIHGVL